MSDRPSFPPVLAAAALLLLLLAVAAALWFLSKPATPPPVARPSSVDTPPLALSALGEAPDWEALTPYARTQTAARFREVFQRLYSDGSPAGPPLFEVGDTRLTVAKFSLQPSFDPFSLEMGDTAPPPRYWRAAAEFPPAGDPQKPLEGVRIAIDPGHIGGAWAKMEERWYQLPGETVEVMEGELTLAVAKRVKPTLEALGATVTLVRESTEPVTALRPEDFARDTLTKKAAEGLFYRKAEIQARAAVINSQIRPDFTLCLHLNAEAWGDPKRPALTEVNHLHMIVNGHYGPDELARDDERHQMLVRLLQRVDEEELPLSAEVGASLAAATGLPPYDYAAGHMAANAHRALPDNPYVWARNLIANRLYHCPVVFCEPYVMNCREVYERIAAGDYDGEREVAGKGRKSLVREYADAVAEGVKAHYLRHRPK